MIEGRIQPGFEEVRDALEASLQRGGGGAVCVYHHGMKVVDIWGGTKDRNKSPWESDTMAMSFSTSKGVVSTLLHQLVDRGLMNYDDHVADHWPEFAAAGKSEITVRQVLTHRAGLPHLRQLVTDAEQVLDWDYMVGALAAARPRLRPGGRSAYHALTYGWLVGEIIQRVDGRRLPEIIRTELADPLGLDGLYIGAPPEAIARAATLRRPGGRQRPLARATKYLPVDQWINSFSRLARITNGPFDPALIRDALVLPGKPGLLLDPRALEVPIPAANGLFTARSLARLYAALANGGELDGQRILSESAVASATEIQTRSRDRVLLTRMNWRLGYHNAFSTKGPIDGAFGHYGYGGSGAFADPGRGLAVAMVNNSTGGSPFGDERIRLIATAALSSASRIRRSAPHTTS